MPTANNVAYTAPINPPTISPVLTIAQVWACLQHKIRAAQDFMVGPIVGTEVLSEWTDAESGNPVMERELVFRDDGKGERPQQRRVRERCVEYAPTRVDFFLQNGSGSTVRNIVSEGPRGQENGDLYLTYIFEWRHPGMAEAELGEARARERQLARISVESTIAAMRDMARDGRIKV